ncbi:MAG TPA: HAD-IIA family hydrolase [Acidimicrobiales bacterium]|nr:HAD-IIA family hydrolase [Acidimicrobiales bacterium]
MAWIIDLDGVIWLAQKPIPGSREAVDRLRRSGRQVVFVTNNSSMTVGDYRVKLESMGIAIEAREILTSAQAAASLLDPGTSALVCAGAGVEEALAERGVEARRDPPADAVVVGWHRDFDFDRLTAACRGVWGGSRLVATNEDATYPTPDGLLPGAGSILAAVVRATGRDAEVAGKPHQPIVDLLAQRAGSVDMVVGDRLDTDGLLARRLGAPFGLVLTGVTKEAPGAGAGGPDGWRPTTVAQDLSSVVAHHIDPG